MEGNYKSNKLSPKYTPNLENIIIKTLLQISTRLMLSHYFYVEDLVGAAI